MCVDTDKRKKLANLQANFAWVESVALFWHSSNSKMYVGDNFNENFLVCIQNVSQINIKQQPKLQNLIQNGENVKFQDTQLKGLFANYYMRFWEWKVSGLLMQAEILPYKEMSRLYLGYNRYIKDTSYNNDIKLQKLIKALEFKYQKLIFNYTI